METELKKCSCLSKRIFMKSIKIYLAILLCFSLLTVAAQNDIRELRIGDKVPDIEFALVNYPTQKARLSDFAGKLIILDFWATWCTGCLHNFPKMDSLQKEFKGKLQVILVNKKSTGDDYLKVERFYEKWKVRHTEFELPSAV